MNMKAVIPLSLAVILGLVAAILVRNAIARNKSGPTQASNLVTVVVAKQDVEPGKELTKEDLNVSKIPAESAPGQIFADPAQLVGRVPTSPLVKGETILETLLAPTGTGSGLQALVPPGMRAITLEINTFSGVGGMLQPGCRVDVLSLLNDIKTHESVSKTILQNIKITAVGRSTSATPPVDANGNPLPPANDITLLCTPHQAQVLELAALTGKPWFVVRSMRDGAESPMEGTTLAELRGDDAQANDITQTQTQTQPQTTPTLAPTEATSFDAAPATIKHTVQVIRGGTDSKVTFVTPAPRGITAEGDNESTVAPETH
jgi:pilus assembly protein CpaB